MRSEPFVTSYESIIKQINEIDPVKYGYSRNHINGAVTRLSPYISRGVISTRMVLDAMFEKGYRLHQMESFVKELCWRDHFQLVAQVKNLQYAIKQEQIPVAHHEMPAAIVNATTGIEAIDVAIKELYQTGYMHNHCRMYTAFLTCNLARAHWQQPAKWMYYHLLDGDAASNLCSWQWVAGANSNKKYYANQENINKYTGSKQTGSYIDQSYEDIAASAIPIELTETTTLNLKTALPVSQMNNWNKELPAMIYNYYNLDPCWHQNENVNRVLLLEPDFFRDYPVSDACISFIMKLAENIPNLQLFTGSFEALMLQYPSTNYHFKEHPLNRHYKGTEEPRDWIAPEVTGYHPSFFSYWKKAEKSIKKNRPNC